MAHRWAHETAHITFSNSMFWISGPSHSNQVYPQPVPPPIQLDKKKKNFKQLKWFEPPLIILQQVAK